MIQELSVEWVASFPGAAYAQLTALQNQLARAERLVDVLLDLVGEPVACNRSPLELRLVAELDEARAKLKALELERTPTDLVPVRLTVNAEEMIAWVQPARAKEFERWSAH